MMMKNKKNNIFSNIDLNIFYKKIVFDTKFLKINCNNLHFLTLKCWILRKLVRIWYLYIRVCAMYLPHAWAIVRESYSFLKGSTQIP